MALFDDASLVTTPNGYKAGTLYSIKPTSGAGDMDVVRATTATRVNDAGLIESVANNVPRLDYTDSTCPSLLVEPQRTNLALYSEQFDNAGWEKAAVVTVSANSVISPDGTQNADTVNCNGTGNLFTRQNAYSGTTSNCSNSIYAKKGNTRYFAFRNFGDSGGAHDVFDFDTETWTNNGGGVLSYDVMGNGWYRLKSKNSDAIGNYYISFFPAENTSGTENATVTNKYVYVWGAQAELGSYPTSYIPTTSAAVTRNADAISKTAISALIGGTSGTVFFDIKTNPVLTSDNYKQFFYYTDSSANQGYMYLNSSNVIITNSSLGNLSSSTTLSSNTRYKIALTYANNDFALYVNGASVATALSGTPFNFINLLSLGSYNGASEFNQFVFNQYTHFPLRLTNAELAQLTTL